MGSSRAFWSTFLGLPVVVARAHPFIPIKPRGHTQALVAALLTEEHARLVVLRLAAPPRALRWAFWSFHQKTTDKSPEGTKSQYLPFDHGQTVKLKDGDKKIKNC